MTGTTPTSVTLADVAAAAGVSLATASRVINGSGERTVGEPYRTKVLAAAEQLGYLPNAQAQAVARGASSLLGLIVQDISDPYFSAIADGVSRVAEHNGLIVLLMSTHQDPDRELDYLTTLRAQRVRAIVVVGSRRDDRRRQLRVRREIDAFVSMGGGVSCVGQDRLGTSTVSPRNREGARELAAAVAGMGHQRFAILGGPPKLLTARDRVTGFREGLAEAGITDDAVHVLPGAFTRDGGYEATREILCGGEAPTCLFAVNDVMAVGAMAALRDAGIHVPEQLSVAGFDDIETLRDIAPSLTTVRLPLREMGQLAAEMALGGGGPRVRRIRGEVILRQSTAPPNLDARIQYERT